MNLSGRYFARPQVRYQFSSQNLWLNVISFREQKLKCEFLRDFKLSKLKAGAFEY